MKECALILEAVKVYICTGLAQNLLCTTILQLYAEAGTLYEQCQCWDKAATVYTRIKNW